MWQKVRRSEFYSKMKNQSKNRKDNNRNIFDKNGLQNGSTPIEADKSCKCNTSNGLHHFNCVPEHLRFNKFVRTGYRVDLGTWDCLKSLFYLHNESFNVYSHGRYKSAVLFNEVAIRTGVASHYHFTI